MSDELTACPECGNELFVIETKFFVNSDEGRDAIGQIECSECGWGFEPNFPTYIPGTESE